MYKTPLEAVRQSVDEDQYEVFVGNKKVVIVSRRSPRNVFLLRYRILSRSWDWTKLDKLSTYSLWSEK